MGNCKDCKWWQKVDESAGLCELTRIDKDAPIHPDSLATVSAEYRGALMTAAEFGCVQFEGQMVKE